MAARFSQQAETQAPTPPPPTSTSTPSVSPFFVRACAQRGMPLNISCKAKSKFLIIAPVQHLVFDSFSGGQLQRKLFASSASYITVVGVISRCPSRGDAVKTGGGTAQSSKRVMPCHCKHYCAPQRGENPHCRNTRNATDAANTLMWGCTAEAQMLLLI